MVYQVTQKEADKLKANTARVIKAKVKSVSKASPVPVSDEFFDDWHKETEKLKAKVTELETTNRNMIKRIFELETKVFLMENKIILDSQLKV